MKLSDTKKKIFFLTTVNAFVRAIGLAMRVWTSRMLGAEIVGIMELAQSVHMASIAPLTSGFPAAVSRLTAKEHSEKSSAILYSGIYLVRRLAFFIIPFLWIFSPTIARWIGEARVLPSLWISSPCILILGYSAVYNGYCYGMEKSEIPAYSELIEQMIRVLLTIFLLTKLRFLTPAWSAAVPAFSTMMAEAIGLWYVARKFVIKTTQPVSTDYTRAIFHLAAPATLSRVLQTLTRSITGIIIPLRLQASGLASGQATSQLGMLNGMVAPILMIPNIFTSAISMVLIPKIVKAEEKPSELGRLFKISLFSTIPISLMCAVMVYKFSPVISNRLFRQSELTGLFQKSVWQIILFPLIHLTGNMLSSLGQQRQAFLISALSSIAMLGLTWYAAGNAALRITGIIYVQYASLLLTFVMNCSALLLWKQKRFFKPDGKFA